MEDAMVGVPVPARQWDDLNKILSRDGPFSDKGFFDPLNGLNALTNYKVLIIGAGGLGCELVKGLALMGFTDIHIIDCDTIDLSNLNRQFLFRPRDIGRSKAVVAAEFINRRVSGCHVTPHDSKIEDKPYQFYTQFNAIVCGLDAIEPRRWLNSMVFQLLEPQADGSFEGIIPIVDGGTEGFKGNARVIIPSESTPCIECQLELFPPRVTFPLCTISNRPRLPEHCIEYARVVLWPREQPFGDSPLDGDDPAHLQWIFDRSMARAKEFFIEGVTYRLTQGVVKHIIPAVASTNAAIASACVTEVFKLATGAARTMNNYMTFNDTRGIVSTTLALEKNPQCSVCSLAKAQASTPLSLPGESTLRFFIDTLIAHHGFVNPIITINGSTYLYMPLLHDTYAENLDKNLVELLKNGQEVQVDDSHQTKTFVISLI